MPNEAKARHLFLTGEKQTGKSTLLRRLIDACALECSGFETRPFFLDGQRRGFTLHGRVDIPPYENDCIVCVRTAQRRSVPVLSVFEENGVSILQRSLASPAPYLLMDELGKLERDAHGFCTQVLSCLDSEKNVLGVLQKCESPLIEQIKSRGDVAVITVTPENRDELFLSLREVFGGASKE